MIRKDRVGGSHDVGVGVATITVVKGMLYDVILSIVQLKITKNPPTQLDFSVLSWFFAYVGYG